MATQDPEGVKHPGCKLKVGDRLYRAKYLWYPAAEVEVIRVGRVYFFVAELDPTTQRRSHRAPTKHHLKTWMQVTTGSQHAILYESKAAHDRRGWRLSAYERVFQHFRLREPVTDDQLKRINDILDEPTI